VHAVIHTRKHGDLLDVVEFTIPFAFKASPQICNQNLGSLVESESASIQRGLVSKAVEILRKEVHERCG
jgi:hypothetical protein